MPKRIASVLETRLACSVTMAASTGAAPLRGAGLADREGLDTGDADRWTMGRAGTGADGGPTRAGGGAGRAAGLGVPTADLSLPLKSAVFAVGEMSGVTGAGALAGRVDSKVLRAAGAGAGLVSTWVRIIDRDEAAASPPEFCAIQGSPSVAARGSAWSIATADCGRFSASRSKAHITTRSTSAETSG